MRQLSALVLILIVVMPLAGICQKSFSVTLHLPTQLELKKISVMYDDGKNQHTIDVDSTYTARASGSIHGRWVNVNVFYPEPDRSNYWWTGNFCVGEEPAEISFDADGVGKDPFLRPVLKNAQLLRDMGRGRLDSFQRAEFTAYDSYIRSVTVLDARADSIASVLGRKLAYRQMEFIRQHPTEYYSIYTFHNWLSRVSYIPVDTALQFFNMVFPDSLKQCFEGRESLKRILARINAREGNKAPDYTTRDIRGREVSPVMNKGKYVLLDFWASWCVPCLASMPHIKKIREDYVKEKLEIISVSTDRRRPDFDKALKEHDMPWTQVFGDTELIKAYNVGGIPQVFLIDPEGKIVYQYIRMDEYGKETGDEGFSRLRQILDGGAR